ncbi:MAG: 30S ribosomal protein S2 [Candidatus Pacebacteria bacterium]|nr:30S ribosomal protein S2 [Candidatus Paceibacterota bacterium]
MEKPNTVIDSMFKAGTHFGFSRSRRNPSVAPYIFGVKNKVEIFDLEKTSLLLIEAKKFVASVAAEGKQIVLVGGKHEARAAIRAAAQSINMPFVEDRWVGGTFTNFKEVRKRIDKLEKLESEREKGELVKYTKKERLMIDREIDRLNHLFSGIASIKEMPKAVFVVDPRAEKIAVKEAQDMGIPVIALAGSDCDISGITYPIVGNDASQESIRFFVNEIVKAYEEGKSKKVEVAK